jgi:Nucleoside-diphosphate-sugar pyrophosphorylase involved in lipopolysaccharide biosynthesis/translation initiation factor 2B, gamma/epsilon subunits (eIF-2Bgamma/eIF-2Bepsilon)
MLDYFITTEDITVLDAMKKIGQNTRGVLFATRNNKLVGVMTDGDIRRYILECGKLDEKISKILNYTPCYIMVDDIVDYKLYMKKAGITAVPIVDKTLEIIRIEFLNELQNVVINNLNIPVVIMAGGKGTRLQPYTDILPKPLMPIGDMTITERIMEKFEQFGCSKFDIIVNYKRNLIKAYFAEADIKRNINFVDEDVYLGTGGGLSLLKGRYNQTFFMTNCDILIEGRYDEMLEYHKENRNIITIVCAKKKVQIPYGIVELGDNNKVKKFVEKPCYSILTNSGFYILEPDFLNKIKENVFIHITDIIEKCINDGEKVGVYTIEEEKWMDMGQVEELEKMKQKLRRE